MKGYYIHKWRLKRLVNTTTEAELYAAESYYGLGATVLEFSDGSMAFEEDCIELSLQAFRHWWFINVSVNMPRLINRKTKNRYYIEEENPFD
jgi:hypothetical protein